MRASLLCSLAFFLPFAGQAADETIRLNPAQIDKAGIKVGPPGDSAVVAGINLPAQVSVPPAQVEVIAAPAATLVTAVRVAYGDTVQKGQALLRLQGGQLLDVQRDFAAARAQAELAAENRRRDEALFADGIIPQSRLSATRAAETQADALAAEKRQTLRMSGLADPGGGAGMTGVAELRAPFDGVVLEVAAQAGQRVDAMTPLVKLARLAPLWLEIQASTAQAARLAPGDTVHIPGCIAPGRITLIAPQMQLASQSQLVRAELAKPGGCVKPFQFVQVVVMPKTPSAQGHWRVPAGALVRHQGQAWVFVAVEGGFRPLAVRVVDEAPGVATVAGDLKADSRLVTHGVATLKAAWLGLGAGSGQ